MKIIAAIAVLAIAIGGGWYGYHLVNRPSCASRVNLSVAAAPEIAPVVQTTANQWSAGQHSGTCVSVAVTAADPADVAAAVAGAHGAVISGLGHANGKVHVPDIWIPDSSTWLARVQAAAGGSVPITAPPVAQSPLVLAMPQPVAQTLGWPKTQLSWAALLQKLTTGSGLKAGIVEPIRDASGLSGLLALGQAAAAAGPAAQQATVAGLRALSLGESTLRADLLGRFPRSADAASIASGLAAAPLPEQAVISYNAAQPPIPLAPVFLTPAPPPLDYPFAELSGLQTTKVSAANGLLAQLKGGSYRDGLAQHGLRAADGSVGKGFAAGPGTPPTVPPTPKPVDAATMSQALNTWTAVTQPGRLLAVLDVSGSMTTPVPTAGNKTREQVTVQAAIQGLGLFGDDWQLGLWTFSTNMQGSIPYRRLVPIGPLASQRTAVATALAGVRPKPDGNTGLYDTVLAAYKDVQQNWDPSRVNSMVIMTDGQNDNPGGLTLNQLTTDLHRIANPAKPVQVIAIGIGKDISQPDLEKITQVTGGGVFDAPDPSKIPDIFLQAIALRPGSGN